MLGKILGAVAGKRIARHAPGISGPGGALLGAGLMSVARRMGPLGLIVGLAGGYAIKRRMEKQDEGATPENLSRPRRAD